LNTIGIIAEYNPFHKGHLYHIRKTRERARADAIIAVISSNFVQRGGPAILDKGVRAKSALLCGVDLVLELPVVFSGHNAGPFANAAVDILAATGVTDVISFGMESPDDGISRLSGLADILNHEPDLFRMPLKKFLAAGYSFVQARSMALDEMIPGSLELLKRPNNNLALAYVKRIREKNYPLTPFAVRRLGAGHNDAEADGRAEEFASAAAIRGLAASGEIARASALMPEASARLLIEARESGHSAHDGGRLWTAIKQSLLRSGARELAGIAGVSEGIENRLMDMAYRSESYDSFAGSCVSRRYPLGRIRRICAHLLLNMRQEESLEFQKKGPAYIRTLGANERGRELLCKMRRSTSLPLIARPSAPWSAYARSMMQFEHRSTELWETLTQNPRARAESRYVPIMTGG
jgi:predicted nucleotidyltransferase